MPTALVVGRFAVPHVGRLAARLGPEWRVETWHPDEQSPEAFAHLAAEADVIIGGPVPLERWPPVPKLRLFQISWTGHEWTAPGKIPAGVPVANVYEHESTIAEYVMLAMLEWQIRLCRMDAEFRARGWGGELVATGEPHGEVRGRTVGILGYGHIGEAVARRARAFDMRVIGIRRARVPCPPELDWLGTPERLDDLLAESDFLVVACDLNAETRGLLDAARLARMKPTAVVINVARGQVIDEQALFDALSEGRIGGAVLDVWWNYNAPGKPEVWPSNLPFHELDNVICSPHKSAWSEEMIERRWDFIARNLERVARGEEPENVVFIGAQTPG